MASWMIHLRIADALLERLPGITVDEFVMGNIAPDSGEPSEDWSYYVPSSEISHYQYPNVEGYLQIDAGKYAAQYFTQEKQKAYTAGQYSFYLGYLTHLLTDVLWRKNVYEKSKALFPEEAQADDHAFLWRCKKDWYDQDHLYLKKHPEFRAFQIYRDMPPFENKYMQIFSEKAFDNRRSYIVGFYTEEHENLDREYPYFTEEQADGFVAESSEKILEWLEHDYLFLKE